MAGLDRQVISNKITTIALATALCALSACTAQPPLEPVAIELAVPVIVEPLPEPVIAEPVAEPAPPIVRPRVRRPNVAIVLSSRQEAYEGVAFELDQYLDSYTVFDLGDKSLPPVSVFRSIEDSDTDAVVAIGLRAAVSATALAKVPVIFCQVFNHQDHGLVTKTSKGISALPPLDLQIAAWKKIDPSLNSVGAIVGPGHEDLIAEAELAAATHGIELHIRTVTSDRETLYVFNRLVGDIDGFWLFPDNRILSAPVLKDMLSYASRRRVQVAVFNDSLLDMGATISSTTVQADIAATIARVVEQIVAGKLDSLPPVTGLSDVRIVTNEAVLKRMMHEPLEASVASEQ